MQYFTLFYLTTAKKVLLLLLHTANIDIISQEQTSVNNIIKYNMGNTDGCAEQYRYASALYLMSVMSQTYSIIIDRGISAPGHGNEVIDGLNAVDKR